MAGTTIDIIYRFLADTRQYEQQIKNMGNAADPSKIAPIDFSQFDKYIGGVKGFNQELNRLVKTQKISADEAKRLKNEYAQMRKDAAELNRILSSTPKGGLAEAFMKTRSRGTGGAGTQGYAPNTQADVDRATKDAALFQKAYSNTFQTIGKKTIDLRTGLKATAATYKQFSQLSREELEKLATTTNKPIRSLKDVGKALSSLVRDFRGFARVGSSLTQIGTTFTIMGAALTGTGFKLASDYIKAVEDGTLRSSAAAVAWNKNMDRIKQANLRIGQVLAQQSIPFLEKGAALLEKLAGYIEKHPEMAALALKTGMVLTGIGAITAAVGKGITLATDVAFLVAAKEIAVGGEEIAAAAVGINSGADKMLLAAAEMNGGSVAKGAGVGLLPLLGQGAIITAVVGAAAIGTDKVFDAIQKRDVKFADYMVELKQILSMSAGGAGWLVKSVAGKTIGGEQKLPNLDTKWFSAVAKALGLIAEPAKTATDNLLGLSDVLMNSFKKEEALKAFEDYKADDLELLRKYYADRKKVEADAQADILKANADLANGIAKAYSDQAAAIAKATSDYKAQELKDQNKYNEDRRKIIADAGEDVLKLEEDLQEKLRKLKMEYEERETELLAARDAVGLIKNRKKYLQDVSEAQRETNKEIAQKRKDTARKLAELQHEYDLERKQRYDDWVAKIKEIQQQTKAEIDQLRQKHAEEMRAIVADRNAKLRELDINLNEERKRRYNAFIATIRDLDAALLGEQQLKKNYEDLMLKDLDAFLAKYRSGMATILTPPPSRQSGGYVNAGLYRLHSGEFVINPSTTSALEQMLGRSLTQNGLMQMVGGGTRNQVVWNDSRRFDSRLQAEDRRMINNDTIQLLGSVVGG